ncbi:pyrophosphate-energised proton pump, partial [Kipferlia bialata]
SLSLSLSLSLSIYIYVCVCIYICVCVGGAFSGTLVTTLSLLGVSACFAIVYGIYHNDSNPEFSCTNVPQLIVAYGFGASFVALFAQVGGGIYTKAADVGADIVGKIDLGIPEDDVRNPAVVADLVGDNVGDCAGRGADLFESTAAENIGAMILAASLAAKFPATNAPAYILFPLVLRGMGLLASIVGIMTVRYKEVAPSAEAGGHLSPTSETSTLLSDDMDK